MGLFRSILDAFSTWTISDKFGPGAGFLYADYASEKSNERELSKMKAGVSQLITNYIEENRKYLNEELIQILHSHLNNISNCNKYNANACLDELKYFLNHKCAYCVSVNEIMGHALETLEQIPNDALDDGVKEKSILKVKEIKSCSDTDKIQRLLPELFKFFSGNGINLENKAELLDKFEDLRRKYLQ